MCQTSKSNHLGDYSIINCQLYGEFKAIKELELGSSLYLKLDDDKNTVLVTSDGNHKTIIGEVQISEVNKNTFLPYLKQNWGDRLYMCKLSQKEENFKLKTTIWIKENK